MTTAYRFDLVQTLYRAEIAELTANQPVRMEPSAVSCTTENCGAQYSLLESCEVTEEDRATHKFVVARAMQQQICPHHPPKIELD